MAYAFCRGIRIYYQEQGSGAPLLLLHGNGEDSGYFFRQMEAFSKKYRVIAPDTRGHGKSGRGTGALNFDCFADDAAALLDALGIQSAHVLGFSDGGNTAILLALRHPGKVRSLILNGADLNPWGVKLGMQAPLVLGYAACRLCGSFSPSALRKSEIMGLMVNHPYIAPERLAMIDAPTLVLVGDRDLIRDSHSKKIARAIPGAHMVVLPDCSHFAAAEHPERFNAVVEDFLSACE